MNTFYEAWTDGAVRGGNPGNGACAFVVFKDGDLHYKKAFLLGNVTNNNAEYQALLKLLEWACLNDVHEMTIYSDSQLVVNQINGKWSIKLPLHKLHVEEAKRYMFSYNHTIKWVRGHAGDEGNEMADKLCNDILDEAKNDNS